MNNTQKVLISGLLGIAAGATAGVLLAPASGKKTRKKIAKSAEDLKSSMEDFVEQSTETLKDLAKQGKEEVEAKS